MNFVFPFFRLLLFIIFIIGLTSCIDPYDTNFDSGNKVLVVQGFLSTDTQKPDTIKIQYSIYNGVTTIVNPVPVAHASIIAIDSKQEIKLIEISAGRLLPPLGFKINIAEKYKLKFTLSDGQQYESTPQQLIQTPPIDKIYDKFNKQSYIANNRFVSANDIYVDFQDNSKERNFYLWRYKHYEETPYCITCGSFELLSDREDKCVSRNILGLLDPVALAFADYDYPCTNGRKGGACYNIYQERKVVIFSDVLSNGRIVEGRLIAQIPNYSIKGCLVNIEQMCISDDVYKFYKLLETQGQGTGTLTDAPPEAIVGNIRNMADPNEKVVGVFGLVDIYKKSYWIDRKNTSEPRELILGHKPRIEPQTSFRNPVPNKFCEESSSRTSFKPEGWRD